MIVLYAIGRWVKNIRAAGTPQNSRSAIRDKRKIWSSFRNLDKLLNDSVEESSAEKILGLLLLETHQLRILVERSAAFPRKDKVLVDEFLFDLRAIESRMADQGKRRVSQRLWASFAGIFKF